MRASTVLILFGGVLLAALVAAGALTRDVWRGWIFPTRPAASTGEEDGHAHESEDRITLTPQARANLGLLVKPIAVQTYWRSLVVPGTVIERPGTSDRGVSAPIAGVITRVIAVPGDTVRAGDDLFELRLVSESLQTSQTELSKAARELQFAQDQRERLEKGAKTGAVSEAEVMRARNEESRIKATVQAYRQDLAARGLTPAQIDQAAAGRFVTHTTVKVPDVAEDRPPGSPGGAKDEYEVEELKVKPGEQVQAGQVLAYLSRHQSLYVEGRGFKSELPLLARAAERGWPLTATFAEEEKGEWPPLTQELKIRFLANTVDAASQTFPFYVPLTNQERTYASDGKTYRLWRFRPGQRVRLRVPVEPFEGVFVLPAGAVVREGADAYVFLQNGPVFVRKPVHVLYEDDASAVLANDGSVVAGTHVVHAGAGALNRALKAEAAGGDGGHDHHGHSHDH
jgi:multidrug efflux pump subunit AcrA (membrane-fusion protein)